ncbi:MAG: tyrosine-type recombinase/integrase [Clostridia bacterium]|nr:tyrosine-type recombinase/integrase [Clostridia bacterium]
MKTKLAQAWNEFLLYKRISGVSEKTLDDYEQFIMPFVRYHGMEAPLADITQDRISQYLESLFKRSLAKATIATHIRHIKVFLNWLSKEYEVSFDADKIIVPRTYKKQVLIYSQEEIAQIFEAVDAESEWLSIRNKACIALMLDSGLRRGELCTIKTSDYNRSMQTLTVCGKGEKTRTVHVGKLSARLIDEYLALCPFNSKNALFVNRTGNEMTGNALKQFMSKLQTKLPFKLSCHKLRHNFATNYCLDMYEEKGQMDAYSLQTLLGHSSMAVTMRYIHHAQSIVASKACISHLDKLFIGNNKGI